MRVVEFPDILLEEYASKKFSLPALSSRYAETTSTDEKWDPTKNKVEYHCLPFARTSMLELPIKSAKILCDGDEIKRVIEIIFELKDPVIDFLPGDTIGIQPVNKDSDVAFMLEALDLQAEADTFSTLSIMKTTQKKGAKLPIYIPKTCTYRHLLSYYLNIYSIPKKLFIRSLVEFTENDNERLLLQALCSKEGAQLYDKFVIEKRLTCVDLLRICRSCKPPIGILLENLPRLLPRPYSVANSSLRTPAEVKIVFSVNREENQKGLTTGMLESKVEKFLHGTENSPSTVSLYFRERTHFKYMEEDLHKNIVMIGVGCAVAPFIGFMEHKFELKQQRANISQDFQMWLFGGSRFRYNAIYRQEIYEYLKQGILDAYFESFSREKDTDFKYVQHQILSNAERFVNLILSPETKVFICADGREVSESISKAIVDCIASVCEMSLEEANETFKQMRTECRYIEDIWL